MSDAALTGQSGQGGNASNTAQTQAAVTNSAGGGSHVTTSGNVVSSSDPSTRPDASVGEKLKGDVQGAIQGSIGSLQAATGTMLRNEGMEQKGLEKMAEEDQRLGAKRGVMPVGSERRNETVDQDATNPSVAK